MEEHGAESRFSGSVSFDESEAAVSCGGVVIVERRFEERAGQQRVKHNRRGAVAPLDCGRLYGMSSWPYNLPGSRALTFVTVVALAEEASGSNANR